MTADQWGPAEPISPLKALPTMASQHLRSTLFQPYRWSVGTALVLSLLLFALSIPALVIHFGLVFPTCPVSDRGRRRVLGDTYGLYVLAVFPAVLTAALLEPVHSRIRTKTQPLLRETEE